MPLPGEVAETHLHAGEGSFDVYAPFLKLTGGPLLNP